MSKKNWLKKENGFNHRIATKSEKLRNLHINENCCACHNKMRLKMPLVQLQTFLIFFSLMVSHLIHLNLQYFLGITINLGHPHYLGYHFLEEVLEKYWFTTAEKRLEMCGDFQIVYSLHLEMNYKCIQRTYAYSTWTKGWVINIVLIYEYLLEQVMKTLLGKRNKLFLYICNN